MSAIAATTLQRRIGLGDVVRTGAIDGYRRLAHEPGEAHTVREDLLPGAAQVWAGIGAGVRMHPLLCLAHVTDLQLADVQSPGRFEFFNAEFADPRFSLLVPTQRPNEAFAAHAVEATVGTLNALAAAGSPLTAGPLELAVSTGDAIDNGQWNELQNVLALLDGGAVRSSGDGHRYEGVQQADWPGEIYWHPDGGAAAGGAVADMFRDGFGYPTLPGVLDRAMAAFEAGGLATPWLACHGNHEGLIQGVGRITPELAAMLVGGRKPVALPADLDRDAAYELFVGGAQVFFDGPMRQITADPSRRPISRREFVEAHFAAGARPAGHGFGERNRRDGTAYYAYDLDSADGTAVRFVALDTTCLLGGADGAVDAEQLSWLESVLREAHSTYLAPDGRPVGGGGDDRLVVLLSHHGLDTLTNHRGSSGGAGVVDLVAAGPDGAAVPVVSPAAVEALLHRYPNVVLWLNGHTHTNAVRARPSPHRRPDGSPGGFWEVTTCSIADWPCQSRTIELVSFGENRSQLAIACTMVDHHSPLDPGSAMSGPELAALHRELAGNIPLPGYGVRLAGSAQDRNVILALSGRSPHA